MVEICIYFNFPTAFREKHQKDEVNMVSWNKSIGAASKVILYSIMWWIVGWIIFFFGFGMIGNQMMGQMRVFTGKAPDIPSLFFSFIIMLIGSVIIIIGSLASFLKVSTELIVEEVSRHQLVLKKYE